MSLFLWILSKKSNNRLFINTVDELFKAQMNIESDKENIFSVSISFL